MKDKRKFYRYSRYFRGQLMVKSDLGYPASKGRFFRVKFEKVVLDGWEEYDFAFVSCFNWGGKKIGCCVVEGRSGDMVGSLARTKKKAKEFAIKKLSQFKKEVFDELIEKRVLFHGLSLRYGEKSSEGFGLV